MFRRRAVRALLAVLPVGASVVALLPAQEARAAYIPCVGKFIVVSPVSGFNNAGATHTVTAIDTCLSLGVVANDTLYFTIVSGPNTGGNATVVTDGFGRTSYSYISNGQPGTDTIRSCDAGTPAVCSLVTVTWGGGVHTWEAGPPRSDEDNTSYGDSNVVDIRGEQTVESLRQIDEQLGEDYDFSEFWDPNLDPSGGYETFCYDDLLDEYSYC